MKKITLFFLMITSFSSCVYFLYPITENDADLVFEKRLLGKWQMSPESEKYIVDTTAISGNLKYDILHISNDFVDTIYLTGKTMKIENELYIDCELNKKFSDDIREAAAYMVLPVHIFYKIRFLDNNSFILSSFDTDKLREINQKNKLNFNTAILPDSSDVLILDHSKDLQLKLRQLNKFPEAFVNDTLRRVMN